MAQAALFARLDCNGDGKVSRSECRLRGLVATDIDDLFALGDADSTTAAKGMGAAEALSSVRGMGVDKVAEAARALAHVLGLPS